MLTHLDLSLFLQRFREAKTISDLRNALDFVTISLGFGQFAMGHHVNLILPPTDAIRLSSYDQNWIDHVIERKYFLDDPVHAASIKTACGFLWSDVESLIRLSPRQRQILAEASGFGLGVGFTVPVYIPGEYHGTCSFGASSLDHLKVNALPIAQLCGSFAFETARRILRRDSVFQAEAPPILTSRQQEALVYVGRGKTDVEIGQLMNISTATAHEHVEAVRRAYGNAQRAYMIVRALFDGQISFSDLLRR